jgi:hypothetical protein
MRSVGRMARTEKGFPFTTKDLHHISIKRGGIARPERHHRPAVLFVVRSEKSKLLLIARTNTDLMIAGFVVKGNKK